MAGLVEGKIAIITGCGAGLGRGLGRALAREGAIVCGMARREDKIMSAGEEFKAISGDTFVMVGDVGKREDCKKLVDEVTKKFGTVDILLNNAMSMRYNGVADTTDEDLEIMMSSAPYGSLYMMQYCFPFMKAQRSGKVVNFGSEQDRSAAVGTTAYAMAKAACLGLTRSAAAEWAQYNIQVNAICPTAVSESWEKHVANSSPEDIEKTLAMFPMGHLGDPDTEIAGTILFLSSYLSDYFTARTIFVDGGFAVAK